MIRAAPSPSRKEAPSGARRQGGRWSRFPLALPLTLTRRPCSPFIGPQRSRYSLPGHGSLKAALLFVIIIHRTAAFTLPLLPEASISDSLNLFQAGGDFPGADQRAQLGFVVRLQGVPNFGFWILDFGLPTIGKWLRLRCAPLAHTCVTRWAASINV
jgi:hypothetical protein